MVSRRDSIIPILKVADLVVVVCAFLAAIGLALRGTDFGAWLPILELRVSVENAIYFSIYLIAWHYTLRSVGLFTSSPLAPAAREVSLNVPLVVRLEGTNVDLGKKIMAEAAILYKRGKTLLVIRNTVLSIAMLAAAALFAGCASLHLCSFPWAPQGES